MGRRGLELHSWNPRSRVIVNRRKSSAASSSWLQKFCARHGIEWKNKAPEELTEDESSSQIQPEKRKREHSPVFLQTNVTPWGRKRAKEEDDLQESKSLLAQVGTSSSSSLEAVSAAPEPAVSPQFSERSNNDNSPCFVAVPCITAAPGEAGVTKSQLTSLQKNLGRFLFKKGLVDDRLMGLALASEFLHGWQEDQGAAPSEERHGQVQEVSAGGGKIRDPLNEEEVTSLSSSNTYDSRLWEMKAEVTEAETELEEESGLEDDVDNSTEEREEVETKLVNSSSLDAQSKACQTLSTGKILFENIFPD